MSRTTGTFAYQLTRACAQGRVESPARLLAIGVLLRWAEDIRLGRKYGLECGDEWFEMADVPIEWREVVVA